jgi:hypothetical protein
MSSGLSNHICAAAMCKLNVVNFQIGNFYIFERWLYDEKIDMDGSGAGFFFGFTCQFCADDASVWRA